MDETTIYIADAAGNVVCRTHSNGGTAIWDGKTQSGKKAHSGVYTIYCNTADGKNHTVLKLLLMH
jgi:flagellar hook assembly protein FlgD